MSEIKTPRPSLSLDGAWDFKLAGAGAGARSSSRAHGRRNSPTSAMPSGRADYRRRFALPAEWRGREVVIRFGAVNYFCRARLNGVPIGEHEGGYLPFEFILPAASLAPENTLEVEVTLPTSDASAYPEWPITEVPHGKQSWYGPIGGIWQSVALEARDRRHIRHVGIRAELTGSVARRESCSPPRRAGPSLRTEIFDPDGKRVAANELAGRRHARHASPDGRCAAFMVPRLAEPVPAADGASH